MKAIKTHSIPNTAFFFILAAPVAVLFYGLYIFNPSHIGNPYLYFFLLVADIIGITIVGTLWLTILLDILQPDHHKREIEYSLNWVIKTHPTVDILIPVANEPLEIIENTIRRAAEMNYPHYVYVLDDGESEFVKQLALSLGINYIARPKHAKSYAKSGNLNYGLKFAKSEFFAVFDADHAPVKEFITEILPFFVNKQVSLVQTPQYYTNTDNFIASGTAQAQEIFYKYVQPAKNSYNAAFSVGTNVMYRRSDIDAIGGIPLRHHSEDIWTAIKLHEKGHHSVFYNKVLAYGRAPETISAFFRQQNRWALGGFSLFFTHNPLFSKELSLDQKMQYFFSNIHYFSGFAILIYLLLPIVYLLFGAHPMKIGSGNAWFFHYLPYAIIVYSLPLLLLRQFKLSTISVSLASFYPYLRAFFSVVFKTNYKWVSTESQKKGLNIIMTHIWPHVFIIVLSLLSLLIAWYNPIDITTTVITTLWVLVNTFFLIEFVKHAFRTS